MTTAVSPSTPDVSGHDTHAQRYEWLPVGVVGLGALLSAIYPVVRMFYNIPINYNEGWNVYTASEVTRHIPLYTPQYSWTTVNYPALSFYVVSWLHRLGFGYLLTGRVLSLVSLLASCVLVGLVVWRLSGDYRSATFASFFCLAVFCNAATGYVGMDDPQILAQAFFLAGLVVYISGPPGWGRIGATSLLFILGGNIKHSPVEFPLAVLVDLCFVSRRKVAGFLAISAVLLVASIAGSMWADGPYFASKILMPRTFSLMHAATHLVLQGFAPLQIPMLVAAVWSVKTFRDTKLRVLTILFWASLVVGAALGGGAGVNVNMYFGLFLSISMMLGLFVHWLWKSDRPGLGVAAKVGVPLVLLLSLAPSWFAVSHRTAIQELPAEQEHFQAGVSFLSSRPGTAICETLLLCYEAGKPYTFDPFNSLMLIRAGRLNERSWIERLDKGEIGAVDFGSPVASYVAGQSERFTPAFAAAVANHYQLAFKENDCYIYVPKSQIVPSEISQSSSPVHGPFTP